MAEIIGERRRGIFNPNLADKLVFEDEPDTNTSDASSHKGAVFSPIPGLDTIVKLTGTFEEQRKALPGNLWFSSSQIQSLRILTNDDDSPNYPELRNYSFRVSDGAVYCLDDKGNFMLYLTPAYLNPILNPLNVASAISEIKHHGHYSVGARDLQEIVKYSKKPNGGVRVFAVNLSNISLEQASSDKTVSQLIFSPEQYRDAANLYSLRGESLRFAKLLHARDRKMPEVMDVLDEYGISLTRIRVLNLNYMHTKATNSAIACLSTLSRFNSGSDVNSNSDINLFHSNIERDDFYVLGKKENK
jgi:hypothetical protein